MAKEKEIIEQQEMVEAPEEVTSTPEEATTPELTVTETSTTVTPKSRTREWMEKKYPERTWESDEVFYDDVANELESAEGRLAEYADADTKIGRILDANPEFALAIEAMASGMPARVAIRRYLGDILAEPEEGEDDFEAYQEAAEQFLAEKKKADEEIATRTANLEKSDIILKEFVERNFPTEQEQIDFVEFLRASLRNMHMGEFSEAFFDMMLKAYKHDTDVEDAKEAGAIEARNEKITAKRIKEKADTDGLPMGGGSSPVVEEDIEDEEDAIDSVLRSQRRSIF